MLVAIADGGAQFGSAEHATRGSTAGPNAIESPRRGRLRFDLASEAGEVGLA
jgi:hypothetical protein